MSEPRPRKYLAIKYSAPPGTCKCGECQLVPPEMLMVWDDEIERLRAVLATIADSYWIEPGGKIVMTREARIARQALGIVEQSKPELLKPERDWRAGRTRSGSEM